MAKTDTNTLLEKEDEWTTEDKQLWVKSHDLKDDAKKCGEQPTFVGCTNKSEMAWLNLALTNYPTWRNVSRTIMNNLIESGHTERIDTKQPSERIYGMN